MTRRRKHSSVAHRLAIGVRCVAQFVSISALLYVSAASATNPSLVTIASPAHGSTVRPGAVVFVNVDVDPSVNAESVIFMAGTGEEDASLVEVNAPPHIGSFVVPRDFSGPLEIGCAARKVGGGFVEGQTINVNVVPEEAPTALEAHTPEHLRFSDGVGTTGKIVVTGIYEDDVRRDLSSAALGTTYEVADTSVVSVDINGGTLAKAAGSTMVTIRNGSLKTYVEILVTGPEGSRRGMAKDITSQVSITKSGFRRDPATRRFVQLITIRNNGTLPLAFPIRLVISGLPEGVDLENAKNRTRTVEPIGSPIARVKPPEGNQQPYLAPGATGTAQLEFSNRDGRPITYRMRLYYGAKL